MVVLSGVELKAGFSALALQTADLRKVYVCACVCVAVGFRV